MLILTDIWVSQSNTRKITLLTTEWHLGFQVLQLQQLKQLQYFMNRHLHALILFYNWKNIGHLKSNTYVHVNIATDSWWHH